METPDLSVLTMILSASLPPLLDEPAIEAKLKRPMISAISRPSACLEISIENGRSTDQM